MYGEYFTTITDAYNYFTDLHGSDEPLRTSDELRDKIHEYTTEYTALGWYLPEAFWAELFDSGWAYTTDTEDA